MLPPPVPGAAAVAFDDAAADQLSIALLGLADDLRAASRRVEAASVDVVHDWYGATRTWFDAQADAARVRLSLAAARADVDAATVQADRARAAAHQEQLNQEALDRAAAQARAEAEAQAQAEAQAATEAASDPASAGPGPVVGGRP